MDKFDVEEDSFSDSESEHERFLLRRSRLRDKPRSKRQRLESFCKEADKKFRGLFD